MAIRFSGSILYLGLWGSLQPFIIIKSSSSLQDIETVKLATLAIQNFHSHPLHTTCCDHIAILALLILFLCNTYHPSEIWNEGTNIHALWFSFTQDLLYIISSQRIAEKYYFSSNLFNHLNAFLIANFLVKFLEWSLWYKNGLNRPCATYKLDWFFSSFFNQLTLTAMYSPKISTKYL